MGKLLQTLLGDFVGWMFNVNDVGEGKVAEAYLENLPSRCRVHGKNKLSVLSMI